MADAYYRSSHTGEEIDQAIDNYNDLKNAAETAGEQAEIATLAAQQAWESSVSANYKKTMGYIEVTLTVGGWVSEGTDAPFFQAIPVSGLTDSWVPGQAVITIPSVEIQYDDFIAMKVAASCIDAIISDNGYLYFVCMTNKPSVTITVKVPGLEARSV